MKPKVVEVDIKSHRQDRAVGDAPDIGRVAKVAENDAGSEEDASEGQFYDESERKESGEWLLRLGIISGLLVVLIVSGGIIYFTVVQKLNPGPGGNEGIKAPDQIGAADHTSLGDRLLSEDEGLDLVRRGLAVRFVSKVSDYFVYAGKSSPPEIIGFLKDLSKTDGLITGMEWLPPEEKKGILLAKVKVHSNLAGDSQVRIAWLLQNSEGDWRIDFHSFAHKVEPDLRPGK